MFVVTQGRVNATERVTVPRGVNKDRKNHQTYHAQPLVMATVDLSRPVKRNYLTRNGTRSNAAAAAALLGHK